MSERPRQADDMLMKETQTFVSPSEAKIAMGAGGQTFGDGSLVAGRFQIVRFIAQGGMGEVYEAQDKELGTPVALKTIRPAIAANAQFLDSFKQEVNLARKVTHPNVCRVFDFFYHHEASREVAFLTMELVQGETLSAWIRKKGRLSKQQALPLVKQMAEALESAHQKGVIHRDFKSANVILEGNGDRAVVTDFGLARLTVHDKDGSLLPEAMAGTPDYMAPEQVEGGNVSPAADIYALGVVLYEMITGALPFSGSTPMEVASKRLQTPPLPPRSKVADLDPMWERTILRCLERDPSRRFPSALDVVKALAPRSQPRFAWVALATIVLAAASLVYFMWRGAEEKRIRAAVAAYMEKQQNAEAFLLAQRHPSILTPKQLDDISRMVNLDSTPPGAEVQWKPYEAPEEAWQPLGRTPLKNVRVPFGGARVRVALEGFETIEGAFALPFAGGPPMNFSMARTGAVRQGMVFIPAGRYGDRIIPGNNVVRVDLPAFTIDKFEVTNRQFQRFVDSGGYENSAYWQIPFLRDGLTIPWEQARREFLDSTNRPGPAGWAGGRLPKGRDDFPVGGISWYEAAAYARWSGKELPTIFHWRKAADITLTAGVVPNPGILRLANFSRRGAVAVGSIGAITRFGAHDMAGNVREWCWNHGESGKRYVLGGSYNDDPADFIDPFALSPWDRSDLNGFRCMRSTEPLSNPVTETFVGHLRDLSKEKPVSDQEFEAFRNFYEYERTSLEERLEATDTSNASWTKEKVSLRTPYGNERMNIYLFLPRNAKRPLQTVVFSPWVTAQFTPSSSNLVNMEFLEFVIQSGRAVVYPVYQGMYERANPSLTAVPRDGAPTSPIQQREIAVMRVKDLRRTIDYLETRTDLHPQKRGYYGASLGGNYIPFLAVESRFLAAISVEGCILRGDFPRPEADPLNFAPRMKLPFLMINGRFDSICPVETAQKPFFRWMGTAEKDKKHVLFDTGHFALAQRDRAVAEILGWLDRYLGPVD